MSRLRTALVVAAGLVRRRAASLGFDFIELVFLVPGAPFATAALRSER